MCAVGMGAVQGVREEEREDGPDENEGGNEGAHGAASHEELIHTVPHLAQNVSDRNVIRASVTRRYAHINMTGTLRRGREGIGSRTRPQRRRRAPTSTRRRS